VLWNFYFWFYNCLPQEVHMAYFTEFQLASLQKKKKVTLSKWFLNYSLKAPLISEIEKYNPKDPRGVFGKSEISLKSLVLHLNFACIFNYSIW
jgi:hypothetical protein